MGESAGAGFFSDDWGYLPRVYSNGMNGSRELSLVSPGGQQP
jgi:hypothetical protein